MAEHRNIAGLPTIRREFTRPIAQLSSDFRVIGSAEDDLRQAGAIEARTDLRLLQDLTRESENLETVGIAQRNQLTDEVNAQTSRLANIQSRIPLFNTIKLITTGNKFFSRRSATADLANARSRLTVYDKTFTFKRQILTERRQNIKNLLDFKGKIRTADVDRLQNMQDAIKAQADFRSLSLDLQIKEANLEEDIRDRNLQSRTPDQLADLRAQAVGNNGRLILDPETGTEATIQDIDAEVQRQKTKQLDLDQLGITVGSDRLDLIEKQEFRTLEKWSLPELLQLREQGGVLELADGSEHQFDLKNLDQTVIDRQAQREQVAINLATITEDQLNARSIMDNVRITTEVSGSRLDNFYGTTEEAREKGLGGELPLDIRKSTAALLAAERSLTPEQLEKNPKLANLVQKKLDAFDTSLEKEATRQFPDNKSGQGLYVSFMQGSQLDPRMSLLHLTSVSGAEPRVFTSSRTKQAMQAGTNAMLPLLADRLGIGIDESALDLGEGGLKQLAGISVMRDFLASSGQTNEESLAFQDIYKRAAQAVYVEESLKSIYQLVFSTNDMQGVSFPVIWDSALAETDEKLGKPDLKNKEEVARHSEFFTQRFMAHLLANPSANETDFTAAHTFVRLLETDFVDADQQIEKGDSFEDSVMQAAVVGGALRDTFKLQRDVFGLMVAQSEQAKQRRTTSITESYGNPRTRQDAIATVAGIMAGVDEKDISRFTGELPPELVNDAEAFVEYQKDKEQFEKKIRGTIDKVARAMDTVFFLMFPTPSGSRQQGFNAQRDTVKQEIVGGR